MTWPTKILPFTTRVAAVVRAHAPIDVESFPRFWQEWNRPVSIIHPAIRRSPQSPQVAK